MKIFNTIRYVLRWKEPTGTRIAWHDLTKEEQRGFVGRCGPNKITRSETVRVFHLACKLHDFAYQRGGTGADRAEADRAFFTNMQTAAALSDCKHTQRLYRCYATVFYWAVRCGGALFFTYGDYLTKEEILAKNAKYK